MINIVLASDARALIQDVLVFALCIVALFGGSTPERAAITIWLLCLELPHVIYRHVFGLEYELIGVDPILASTDVLAGALWIALALYANRNYTLWIAGAQLLAIGSHVSRGLVESISPIGYVFLVVAPGWIVLLMMAIGFTRHIRRKRRYGVYRDWRIVRRSDDAPTLKRGKLA